MRDDARRAAAAERARVLAGHGQLLMLLDRFAESRALCEEAIAIARQVGARQAEGHAKNTLGVDLNGQGLVDAGNASCASRSRSPRRSTTSRASAARYINLSDALLLGGDIERAADVVDEASP